MKKTLKNVPTNRPTTKGDQGKMRSMRPITTIKPPLPPTRSIPPIPMASNPHPPLLRNRLPITLIIRPMPSPAPAIMARMPIIRDLKAIKARMPIIRSLKAISTRMKIRFTSRTGRTLRNTTSTPAKLVIPKGINHRLLPQCIP